MIDFSQNEQFEKIDMYSNIESINRIQDLDNIQYLDNKFIINKKNGCGTSMSGYYKCKHKVYIDQIIVISLLSIIGLVIVIFFLIKYT